METGTILQNKGMSNRKVKLLSRYVQNDVEIGWLVYEDGAKWCLLDVWLSHWKEVE